MFPCDSNEAKSLVFWFISTMAMELLDLSQFQRTMSAAYPLWSVSEERERNWPKMRFPSGWCSFSGQRVYKLRFLSTLCLELLHRDRRFVPLRWTMYEVGRVRYEVQNEGEIDLSYYYSNIYRLLLQLFIIHCTLLIVLRYDMSHILLRSGVLYLLRTN